MHRSSEDISCKNGTSKISASDDANIKNYYTSAPIFSCSGTVALFGHHAAEV